MKISQIIKQSLLIVLGWLCIHIAFAEVRVYIDQPHYNLTFFEETTLAVNIDGLTADTPLRGYQVHFDFSDTYLEVSGLAAFQEGTFLSAIGLTQWYVIAENGGYTATCSILDHTPGAIGAGTLFYLTLKAKDQSTGAPGTDIILSNVILRDPLNHPIVADTIDSCNIIISPGVMIYVDLPHYDLVYNQEVILAIKIQGTADLALRGYQVHLEFDDTYLEVSGLSAFTEGPYLSDIGQTQWYAIEDNGGFTVTCSILDYTTGAFNSGTLFYVTLKAKNQSTGVMGTDVVLSEIKLRDPLNHPIGYISENGNIVIEAPLYIYTGIKVFLQGSYVAGGTMRHELADNHYIPLVSPYNNSHSVTEFPDVAPKFIVDWIYVQLRVTATGPYEQSKSCFLLNDGTIVDLAGNPQLAFDYTGGFQYFTAVRHRNHLAVMSVNASMFSSDPLAVTVADLTVLDSVYGGNYLGIKEIEPGVLALYSGDADQSGVVSPTDANLYWRMQTGFLYGYYSADFGMDGNVLPSDLNLFWRPNSGKISQIP